ncbi:unnamed protein product [Camellia sinensis]
MSSKSMIDWKGCDDELDDDDDEVEAAEAAAAATVGKLAAWRGFVGRVRVEGTRAEVAIEFLRRRRGFGLFAVVKSMESIDPAENSHSH